MNIDHKCSICYENIFTNIYQCNNGHLTCNSCVQHINHCPVCRSADYKIRNLLLEDILKKLVDNNLIENNDNEINNINEINNVNNNNIIDNNNVVNNNLVHNHEMNNNVVNNNLVHYHEMNNNVDDNNNNIIFNSNKKLIEEYYQNNYTNLTDNQKRYLDYLPNKFNLDYFNNIKNKINLNCIESRDLLNYYKVTTI